MRGPLKLNPKPKTPSGFTHKAVYRKGQLIISSAGAHQLAFFFFVANLPRIFLKVNILNEER